MGRSNSPYFHHLLLFFLTLSLPTFIYGYAQKGTPSDTTLIVDPEGHTSIIRDMVYSAETGELLTVGDDKIIRLWDIDDELLSRSFHLPAGSSSNHGRIYAIDIAPDGRTIALGGYFDDHQIYIIDIQTATVLQLLEGHKSAVFDLDFSRDGTRLASGDGSGTIKVWKRNNSTNLFMDENKSIQEQTSVDHIAFSPDDDKIVYSFGDQARLLSLDNDQKPVLMQNHLGKITAMTSTSKGFFSGDDTGVLNYWSWDGSLNAQVKKFPQPITALEASESRLFISSDRQYLLRSGADIQVLFEENLQVTAAGFSEDDQLHMGFGNFGSIVSMHLASSQDVSVVASQGLPVSELAIKSGKLAFKNKEGETIGFFDFEKEQIIRDKELFTGFQGANRSDGNFTVVRVSETQISLGSQISVNNDGDDGRIRSYHVTPTGDLWVGSDLSLIIHQKDGDRRRLKGHLGPVLSIVSDDRFVYTYGGDQVIRIWDIEDGRLRYNFFVTKAFDWILWNESGNYLASAGGEEFLYWKMSTGVDRMAKVQPIDAGEGHQNSNSINQLDANSTEDLKEPPASSIVWLSPSDYKTTTNKSAINLKAKINSNATVQSTKILVSGRPLPTKRDVGSSDKKIIDEVIDLYAYETTVQIFAKTTSGKIISEKRVIVNEKLKGKSAEMQVLSLDDKPNLYYLGIGISEFANSEYNLTYADDDAVAMKDIFTAGTSKGFGRTEGTLLLNEEATAGRIMEEIKQLKDRVEPKDQVVLFMASHGVNEDGFYYVLSHDANAQDLKGSCLDWKALGDLLSAFPCRVLLFLDTCHSGALGSSLYASDEYIKNTEALRNISDAEIGVVIMSASTGQEVSLESEEWKHGVFTHSLIEGLKEKKAEIKKDGVIFLRELDFYVSNLVNELTRGKQNPTTQKPSTISKMIVY